MSARVAVDDEVGADELTAADPESGEPPSPEADDDGENVMMPFSVDVEGSTEPVAEVSTSNEEAPDPCRGR